MNPTEEITLDLLAHGPSGADHALLSPAERFQPGSNLGRGRLLSPCGSVPASLLSSGSEDLVLQREIEILTEEEGDGVVWRIAELQLTARAATDVAAEAAMLEQMKLLRDEYRDEPDAALTPGARDLKRRILEIFG